MKPLQLILATFVLAACNFPGSASPTQTVVSPTAPASATIAVQATAAPLSFDASVYVDPANRFEISYPADWMVDEQQAGSRASLVQITSWTHAAGGFSEIPAGGSVLQIAVYQWDPVRDLAARVAMRRENFLSSGNVILEETAVSYPGGHDGTRFLLQDTDGGKTVVVLLELGDDYLELSGNGADIALLEEMISSFSFIVE